MITVVITTYKRPLNTLKRAVDTVLNQSYTNWELIIVDDSPDSWELRSIISSYASDLMKTDYRIRYIAHKKNLGACAARNTGLLSAKGELIAYLDDDDEWVTDKLRKQEIKMKTCNEDVALIYCGSIYYDEKKRIRYIHKDQYLKGKVFDKLITKNFIGGTSFPLIRTNALKKIGGFDERMPAGQDADVWLRLSQIYNIDFVDEPLVIYHIHNEEQISSTPEKRIKGNERKIEKYCDYFRSHPKAYSCCLMDLACAYAFGGKSNMAMRTWHKAVSIDPVSLVTNLKSLFRIIKWYSFGKGI